MADIRFIAFELLSIVLFCLCLSHAFYRSNSTLSSKWYVMELISATCFGLLLEYVDTHYFDAYHYGQFALNVFSIPVCIGLLWGVIIYTSMLTSDCWGIPLLAAPFADVIQALNIDMGMDIVAIRIGMWNWDFIPQQYQWTAEWFGVPYGNFYGWMLVVFFFSSILRLLRILFRNKSAGFIATLCGFIAVILICEVMLYLSLYYAPVYHIKPIVIGGLIFSVCLVALSMKWHHKLNIRPLIIAIAPNSIHLFFIAMLFTNISEINTQIIVVILFLFVCRLLVDLTFFRSAFAKKGPST